MEDHYKAAPASLLHESFRKICNFLVLAVFPFAELFKNIDALIALKNVAFCAGFARFAVTCVSGHRNSDNLLNFRNIGFFD